MEPLDYEKRCKHESLPLDFQYQDAVSYASNWDYLKEKHSNYHFDKFKSESEGEWWNDLGHFKITQEMRDMLPRLEEAASKVGWFDVTSTHHPGFPGAKSPMLDQEEYDRIAGGQAGREFTQVVPEPSVLDTPFQAFGEYFKMKRMRTRIHVQMPGQMFSMHIDKLWHRYPNDPKKILRICVMLSDYEPGQVLVYGNSVFTQWREGAVHCFDTLNVPHSTANMSRVPRFMMVITGIRTEETDTILRSSNHDTTHSVSPQIVGEFK